MARRSQVLEALNVLVRTPDEELPAQLAALLVTLKGVDAVAALLLGRLALKGPWSPEWRRRLAALRLEAPPATDRRQAYGPHELLVLPVRGRRQAFGELLLLVDPDRFGDGAHALANVARLAVTLELDARTLLHAQAEAGGLGDFATWRRLGVALETIGSALLRSPDLHAGLKLALDQTIECLDLDGAVVETASPQGEWRIEQQSSNPIVPAGPHVAAAGVRAPPADGELTNLVVVPDALSGEQPLKGYLLDQGLRSLLAVPLMLPEPQEGFLVLVGRAARTLGPLEIGFARAVANMASMTMANAHLVRAAADTARLAGALADIGHLLHETSDPEEILARVMRASAEAMYADRAALILAGETEWTLAIDPPFVPEPLRAPLAGDEVALLARAVAGGEVLVLEDAQSGPDCARALARLGGRSALCLPVIDEGRLLGVAVFSRDVVGGFPPAVVDFASLLVKSIRTALASAQAVATQQQIAAALQVGLVHPLVPVGGCRAARATRTAHDRELIGGDLSDVFAIGADRVGVLIGDVAGKGIDAAGLTETVHTAVHALTLAQHSPASILRHVNELLLQRPDEDAPHVTALFAVIHKETGVISFASAGHPLPVIVGSPWAPFAAARLLTTPIGTPLGALPCDYVQSRAVLQPGETLVAYTDGVTEARRGRELYGEHRLLALLAPLAAAEPAALVEIVANAATEFGGPLADDLEVVAVRLEA